MKRELRTRIVAAALLSLAAACASREKGAAAPAPVPGPAKGYAIAEIAVNDREGYAAYVAAVGPIVARFGGVYRVRGGETVAKEGPPPGGRVVVIEFPSLAAARAFYDSPDYQAILPLRLNAATSRVYLVEGYQP